MGGVGLDLRLSPVHEDWSLLVQTKGRIVKLAFLGDIHGNLPALEAAWEVLEERSPDLVFVTGDLVGYGADGRACLEWIREKADFCCLGNHDAVVCGKLVPWGFRPESLSPLDRCRRDLPPEDVEWLASLPLVVVHDAQGWSLVHGSLHEPEHFHYVLTPQDARACFAKLETPYGCLGHSHVPGLFFEPSPGALPQWARIPQGALPLPETGRFLLNPGSVGQPRDGDPRAGFALFESETRTVEVVRVDYDIGEAARRIHGAGFSKDLGDRLFLGI